MLEGLIWRYESVWGNKRDGWQF